MCAGCARAPVHESALQLLQLLDKRFFGAVGPLPAADDEGARNNTETPFSTAKMMTLLQTACAEVTTEDWRKVVEKRKKIILQDFERDF
ncbi:putative Heat containing protein [Operophtera brumata]|uniref:Putative Heat containing protein n=1 Tax=Operophtera brumata TaxID=104452 RepID=A0A0L7KZ19_OPEBR|nr:putative Heat containing protein [Operophtera brumata]